MMIFEKKNKSFVDCLLFISFAVIIEKLLRTCDIESIYILIRAKKNDDIHTRLGKIFDDSVRISNIILFLQ